MAVLKTTSPTARPGAPTESPSNTVPSASARIAGWVTWGFAYVGLQETAGTARNRPEAIGIRRAGMIAGGPRGRHRGADRWSAADPGSALQEVGHPVLAGRAPRQPARGMEGAADEHVAAGRTVDEFDALARAGELHGVLADDVARAQRRVARRRAAAGRGLAQRERGARR